jgi:hypothetical protein
MRRSIRRSSPRIYSICSCFANGSGEERITLVLKLIEPAFLTYTDFDLTVADNPATTTINED